MKVFLLYSKNINDFNDINDFVFFRSRSRNHESLKEIGAAIRFLKRKEKTYRFRLKDKDCKEAVEKVFKCLRELTRTEPEV